ncbi:MAG: DUF3105 domain-containing protein [Actinomycetota bacterium]
MANKRKRKPRRPPTTGPGTPAATPRSGGGANPERRERKEQARQAREAARKRAQRSARLRRLTTFAVIGAIGVGVVFFLQRAASPRPISQFAVDAAEAAGCAIETPVASAPGSLHLDPGANYTYDEHPATSGYHDPSPLNIPPRVYPAPIQETQAVHNLEHGAVIMYYRQSGDGALPQAIVDRLTTIANTGHNVILAPYEPLPEGTALALSAWNKLQTCPDTVTGPQARDIARGFIEAYLCTSNAPEGNLGEGC